MNDVLIREPDLAEGWSEVVLWKYEDDAAFEAQRPYEILEQAGNLFMYRGVSNLWECLLGNGTGTAGQTLTYFNNGNAYIGVGDGGATAAVATHTDLQGSNKPRAAMVATYPQHTSGAVLGSASVIWQAIFASGVANFAWSEWGIFNASTGGSMLNRKAGLTLGTKNSGQTWTFQVTTSIT